MANNIWYNKSKYGTDRGPWFGELPAPKDDYDFVFISDRTGGAVQAMFEKGLAAAKRLNPDFIVSIGDLVEGYWTDESEAHEEWDRIDGQIRALDIPTFQTVGNHDYGTEAMRRVWHERKGLDYYAMRYGDTLFLFANTEADADSSHVPPEFLDILQRANRLQIASPEREYGDIMKSMTGWSFEMTEEQLIQPRLSAEQIDFFAQVLAEQKDAAWTFLCLHQPAWKKPDVLFEQLERLLSDRPYTVVAGHVHYLEVTERAGRQYIQMGKTGGLHCFPGKGDIHHILHVKMRGGVPTIDVVSLEGEGGVEALGDYVKDNG